MANTQTRISIVGNATADAEMRFTPQGKPVANFTVAHSDRKKVGDQWVDGEAAFYRVTAWDKLAEGVAESVRKGQRVVVVGTLSPREFQDRDGNKRLSLDVTAEDVGCSVLFAGQQQRRQSDWPQGADPWAQAGAENPPF